MIDTSREWFIRSESILNTFYTVTRDSTGAFSCTCPDFEFRGNVCKHIHKVKMKIVGKKQKNKLPGGGTMKFKVSFCGGEMEYATTKKEAVQIVTEGLRQTMQNGDRLLWTSQRPNDLFLSAAFVIDKQGDADAFALVEEER